MRTIRQSILIIIIAATAFGGEHKFYGSEQNGRCERPDQPRGLEESIDRPKLSVDYSQVTEFKLVSRKTTYRMDDLISLDMAMRNTGRVPVYFNHLEGNSLIIRVQDEKGSKVDVMTYTIESEIAEPESYDFLKPGKFTSNSYLLIAGCGEGVKAYMKGMLQITDDYAEGKEDLDKGMFERNLFTKWGSACIQLGGPGAYIITAEMKNPYVVVSPCDPDVKTATGAIRSVPLKITVTQ